jgi:large conductance mechanosensitive channel
MISLFNEFKQFLLRGNVIDLAVAVIIGAAFTGVVTAAVEDIFTPLIAAVFGEPDFSGLTFTINGSRFLYGAFLNALISFVLIAAVVFFFIVKPVNMMMSRFQREPAPDPSTRKCPYCFSVIPAQATRCAHCTSEVQPVSSGV